MNNAFSLKNFFKLLGGPATLAVPDDVLFGTEDENKKIDLLTGGQQDLLDQLIQRIQSGSDGFGFDEDFFQKNFADPALREFETRTAPSIQQKFIGAGAARGSNLQDSLTRSGADVQGNINKMRAELLNKALDRQLQGAQTALGQRAFGLQQVPGQEGALPTLLSILGAAGGGVAGGPAGASAGAGAGQAAGQAISRGFRR